MKTKAFYLLKLSALILCLGLGFAGVAQAQWGWTDKDGRRIFSDQGPGSEVADKNIFKRPGGTRTAAAATKTAEPGAPVAPEAAASTPKSPASAAKGTGKDPELEKKKKQLETAEAGKAKVEADKQARLLAENCERAKKSKASYAAGTRIATTNAKGEREILGDTERAAEIKRIEAIMASDCK